MPGEKTIKILKEFGAIPKKTTSVPLRESEPPPSPPPSSPKKEG